MLHTPSGGAGTGATTGATSTGGSGPMSIGAVLRVLRAEFPEVTLSKIRFLESEGLVEPERSASGYRKFSTADVERLREVLRMQRDHYLPLRVIRERLDPPAGRGGPLRLPAPSPPTDPPGPSGRPAPVARHEARPGPRERVGRGELLAGVGAGEAELEQWEAYGLLEPMPEGGYAPGEVALARLMADLGRFGLEPRHLRAVKAAAEREAGLVEQVVAPLRRHRSPRTRAEAEATAGELAALLARLHEVVVRSAVLPHRS